MKNIYKIMIITIVLIVYSGCAQKAEISKMVTEKTDYSYEEKIILMSLMYLEEEIQILWALRK